MNILRANRKNAFKKNALKGIGGIKGEIYVNGETVLNENTFLGRNVNFNGLKIIGKGRVEIGDNFHSGMNCILITDNHNFNGNKIPYDDTYIVREIIIEDNVWIGHGVIILGGVKIGEGAIIQAGAVVVKDIPALGIAGGNPAVVFKQRSGEHYFRLKADRQFH